MPQFSHVTPSSFCSPECAITKLVSNSLIGVWLLIGTPSFCAAHCSHRCFSIFLPFLISVRWTVAALLQLSHFIAVDRPFAASARLAQTSRRPSSDKRGQPNQPARLSAANTNRISADNQRQS